MGAQLSEKIFNDLLLTKAMEKNIGQLDRWDSLNDIVDEVLMNGVIDRDDYFASLVELTQLGYVNSSLKTVEDIKKSEWDGYDIICVTNKGIKYIDKVAQSEEMKEKINTFFTNFDTVCLKVAESGTFKLAIGVAGIASLFL